MPFELPPPPFGHPMPPAPAPAPVFVTAPPAPEPGEPMTPYDVQMFMLSYAKEAGLVQVEIMRDQEQPGTTRLAASDKILDRAVGKPMQRVEVTEPDQFADWTDAELDHYAKTGDRPKR